MSVVVVEDLSKEYGRLRALDGLTFTVAEGEVFALLGPNGAGKTTTMEILEGYRDRTTGRVSVLGVDPATGGRAYRERIGIVLQSAGFEEEFTVRELTRLHARLYPRRYEPDGGARAALPRRADHRLRPVGPPPRLGAHSRVA